MAQFVPAKVIQVQDKGFVQNKWQPAHWADARGNWVPAPTRGRAAATSTRRGVLMDTRSQLTSEGYGGFGNGGYQPWSDADIEARANAMADAQMGAETAAIQRAQAAAQAAAQRDVQTYQGLGQAQMSMIGQIPSNIQAIRDTAAQALASTAGQVTGAQQQQQQGELAQNAAFTASQVGDTAQAAPTPTGINPAGTAAAEQAMGGTIPAAAQINTGESGAIYAAGMPAVVARATQEQIAQRMAQAATQDADYRQQLIDAAAKRGGAYADAVNQLYDIESKRFGEYQAQQNAVLDQQKYELQYRAELANEVAMGIKTKAQAQKDLRNYQLAKQRVGIAQQNATTAAGRAATAKATAQTKAQQSAANYYTDGQGRLVPKGYVYNAQNQLVKQATPKSAKAAKGGVAKANSLAAQMRGTPDAVGYDKKGNKVPIPHRPKVAYNSAIGQIKSALVDMGYPPAQATSIATNAVNAHYGPQYRP